MAERLANEPVVYVHRTPRLVAGALTMSVLLFIATLMAIGFNGSHAARVRIGEASNATVQLPSGERVEAVAGMRLPDGSIIHVEKGGHVVVGELSVSENTMLLIESGRVNHIAVQPPSTVGELPVGSDTSGGRRSPRTTTSDRDDADPGPTTSTPGSPTATTRPTTTRTPTTSRPSTPDNDNGRPGLGRDRRHQAAAEPPDHDAADDDDVGADDDHRGADDDHRGADDDHGGADHDDNGGADDDDLRGPPPRRRKRPPPRSPM